MAHSALNKKAVLITGAGSGIGYAIAQYLAQNGFIVLATVRKLQDKEKLQALNQANLIPVYPLDLTQREHIANAANAVEKISDELKLNGLFALINNAGSSSVGPIELMDLDDFHRQLQTRVLGAVAMVQTFLPLIRKGNGRILWITTPAIIPTPYVANIHACDFAVNCLARTLEIELKPWNTPNIMIRCGGIKTETGLQTVSFVKELMEKSSLEKRQLYEAALTKWAEEMTEFDKKRTEPIKVAQKIYKVLRAKKPKRRYSIGHMAKAAYFLEILPQSVADWILKKHF